MATYLYDDFRVTFTPGADGSYDVRARDGAGGEATGRFVTPLTDDELRDAVLGVARATRARAATRRRTSKPDAGSSRRPGRDVGDDPAPTFDAERLGGALATALLGGSIGAAYDRAAVAARSNGRGIRLTLSLAAAPALLNVPWEFVYRRPRFLASQRQTPLVRLLDTGVTSDAATIESTVRILGVIANPDDLGPLDVRAERRRMELAVKQMDELGRVELDWVEPATPRGLREALREKQYHVLHYVGHSDFTADGDGLLFLESPSGASDTVDATALANLLSDQESLRLVVLNSCEGARTTLTDPFAGVATTLVHLGVPAVVAMQFEISDDAAILFAEELYTNLIGRQSPIDAAVAEARKAIFIEVDDEMEWATPVLFLRDPEIALFRFEVPEAPLLRPPPPGMTPGRAEIHATPEAAAAGEVSATRWDDAVRRRVRRRLLAVGATLAATTAAITFVVSRSDDGDPPATTAAGGAQPTTGAERPRTGFVAVALAERDEPGAVHLYTIDPENPDGAPGEATTAAGAVDTEPAWDRDGNRLAFTRRLGDGDLGLFYVVPGNGRGDRGKQVAPLVVDDSGDTQRLAAWGSGGVLFFVGTTDCVPGPGCADELHRATFTVTDDAPAEGAPGRYLDERSLDTLTEATDDIVADGFSGVRAIAADPSSDDRVAVLDDEGLWIVTTAGGQQLAQPGLDGTAVAFAPSGATLVVATAGDDAATAGVEMFSAEGVRRFSASIAQLDAADTDVTLPDGAIVSLTPGAGPASVLALVDRRVGGDAEPPVFADLDTAADGLAIGGVSNVPTPVSERGEVLTVAL